MPKSPIIERDLLFERLGDGSIRLHDTCAVWTELGQMAEPRAIALINGTNPITNIDIYDATYTRIREIPGDQLYRDLGSVFRQITLDHDRTP